MKKIMTFGTFDVFHIGHLRILEKARHLGNHLSVGVSTDRFTLEKKGRLPVFSEAERIEIVKSIRFVDSTFFEDSFGQKREYILEHKADVLVMGSDWQGKFDEFADICKVVYLPRTPSISTTAVIEKIRE